MGDKMREIESIEELKGLVGTEIGVSDWIVIDQERVDRFADATGDHQWIHVDVERARREMPGGSTIAHGYLTLSLLPMLMSRIMSIKHVSSRVNYGSNRVRFTNTVKTGSRVRARQVLKSVEPFKNNGVQITNEVTIEIEGEERPACIAETITVAYP
jgi:acyl dehydratase